MGNTAPTIKYTGSSETFQSDSVGTFTYSSFPQGWKDSAKAVSDSDAPKPSAVVIKTTDAFGLPTNAVATFPAVADSQGIYRAIQPADYYHTAADVRVDQYSDVDPSVIQPDPNNPGFLLCGCPVGGEQIVDWPMQVGFVFLDGKTDPGDAPDIGLVVSSETHTWHLFSLSQNIVADLDLGVRAEEGKWYHADTEFDAAKGVLHGVVTDITSGDILADKMIFLADPKYGEYDPKVDGKFNAEAYIDGEHSLLETHDLTLTRPNLAVIDNIDTFNHSGPVPTPTYGLGSPTPYDDGKMHTCLTDHAN
jgi:hypothetical protein